MSANLPAKRQRAYLGPAPSGESLSGPPAVPVASVGPLDLYAAFLGDARCDNTKRSRVADIEVFRRFLGSATPGEACATFIAGGRGAANAVGLAFRDSEKRRGLSAGAVNRKNSSLRRLAELARRFDLITWSVDIDNLPDRTVSDRRGPGGAGWRALWETACASDDPVDRRDRALLRLMHDSALRKAEVVALDLGDFDPSRPGVRVTGKGSSGKQMVTVNAPTAKALAEWVEVRGREPGPMFLSCLAGGVRGVGQTKRPFPGMTPGFRRVNPRAVNRMLYRLAKLAGITTPVRPHGLRHAGITRALDLTNGDIRKVARFARHANPRTTMLYDDDRTDMAGAVAGLLGDD